MLTLQIELFGYLPPDDAAKNEPIAWQPSWPAMFCTLLVSWKKGGYSPQAHAALAWLAALPQPECRSWDPREHLTELMGAAIDTHNTEVQPPSGENYGLTIVPEVQLGVYSWPEAQAPLTVLRALQGLADRVDYFGKFELTGGATFHTQLGVVPGMSTAARERYFTRQSSSTAHDAHSRSAVDVTAPYYTEDTFTGTVEGNVFSRDWAVLTRCASRSEPPLQLRAVAAKTEALRLQLCARYPGVAPEIISGVTADGRASPLPFLAIVPLCLDIASGPAAELTELALCLPSAATKEQRAQFLQALGTQSPPATGATEMEVSLSAHERWSLAQSAASSTAYRFYQLSAQIWVSLTPVAVFGCPPLKDDYDAEHAEASIAWACVQSGLPVPRIIMLWPGDCYEPHPTLSSSAAPLEAQWALPARLQHAQLYRVRMHFAQPVEGPVLIGDGREYGLGFFGPGVP